MKVHLFLLIASWLFLATRANWSYVRHLYSYYLTISLRDTFTEPATGTTHILYTVSHVKDDFLMYMRISQEGTVKDQKNFTFPHLTISSARIKGNNYHLVISVNAKRDDTIFDEYYMDSYDDGKVWSGLEKVPREKDDTCLRINDNGLLYVPETGRTFIFYKRTKCTTLENGIVMVTRPKDSQVFSEESLIQATNEVDQSQRVRATYIKGRGNEGVIYVIYTKSTNSLYWTTSTSNGQYWTTPRQLNSLSYEGMILSYAPSYGTTGYFSFAAENQKKLQLQTLSINGPSQPSSFSHRDIESVQSDEASSFAQCHDRQDHLYAMMITSPTSVEFDIVEAHHGKIDTHQNPFDGKLCSGVRLACIGRTDHAIVLAIATCAQDDEHMSIQMATYMHRKAEAQQE